MRFTISIPSDAQAILSCLSFLITIPVHAGHGLEERGFQKPYPLYKLPNVPGYLSGWSPVRCEAFGDSLGGTAAVGRLSWANRCNERRTQDAVERLDMDEATRAAAIESALRSVNDINSVRGMYPTYGVFKANLELDNPLRWQAPTAEEADCSMVDPLYDMVAICTAGCFTPDQSLDAQGGALPILDAEEGSRVLTPHKGARLETLGSPASLTLTAVQYRVSSLGEADETIIDLVTHAGSRLSVTANHPFVTPTGEMVEARTLGLGSLLVRHNGELDPITQLSSRTYHGKVHNLLLNASSPEEQVLIAQGILNGSVYFQNLANQHLNRILFRLNLPQNLFTPH